MDLDEEKRISGLQNDLRQDFRIGLRLTNDRRSNDIDAFCRDLTRLVPKIRVKRHTAEGTNLPAILVGDCMAFCGVPTANELEPFLEALLLFERKQTNVPADILNRLQQVKAPAAVSIYVAPFCRFCPGVLRQLMPLALAAAAIRLTVIDGTLFREEAEKAKVRSVPTIILDGQYRWTGGVSSAELCGAMEHRDPRRLDKDTLQRLITGGGAHDLARMMLEAGSIFPAFIDLLLEENFAVRLAALVTMEELAAVDASLACEVVDPLWQRYPQVADSVKGDVLYLFGELKATQTRPKLQAVLADADNPEIKEAAAEALDKLEQP